MYSHWYILYLGSPYLRSSDQKLGGVLAVLVDSCSQSSSQGEAEQQFKMIVVIRKMFNIRKFTLLLCGIISNYLTLFVLVSQRKCCGVTRQTVCALLIWLRQILQRRYELLLGCEILRMRFEVKLTMTLLLFVIVSFTGVGVKATGRQMLRTIFCCSKQTFCTVLIFILCLIT